MCLFTACGAGKTIKTIEETEPASRTAEQWMALSTAYEEDGQHDAAFRVLESAVTEYGVRDQDILYRYDARRPERLLASVEPGGYSEPITVVFGEGLAEGESLCVLREGRNDYAAQLLDYSWQSPDVLEQFGDLRRYAADYAPEDVFVAEPGMPVEITLNESGWYAFCTFTMKNGIITSVTTEWVYDIYGPDFTQMAFTAPSGAYEECVKTAVTGVEGTVYYTTDGTAPLQNAQPSATARVLEGEVELGLGRHTVKAQCITEQGFVSPVIEANYHVSIIFDSYSIRVGQDEQYDYVVDRGELKMYDSRGEYVGSIAERNVHAFKLVWGYATNEDKIGEYESVMTGWLADSLARPVAETVLYVQNTDAETTRLVYQDGRLVDEADNYKIPYRVVANCWMVYGSDAEDARPYQYANRVLGSAELASDVVLMTSRCAATWTLKDEIVTYDLDGSDKKVRWKASVGDVELHALTDRLIIFSNNGKSLALDLGTDEVREITEVPKGWTIIGCTTHAIYAKDTTGAVQRIAVDYDAL